jgi:hypothetical protein
MSLSNYLEIEILDHIFGEGAYTPPTWYIGLSTADPLDDSTGLAEPADAAYARVLVGATTLTASTVKNDAAITFAAAGESWGVVTHFVLFDALTDGHILASGTLAQSRTVLAGDIVKFAINALTFSLD